jgi:hypothetical protein
MKLILTTDEGEVLGSADLTDEDWALAWRNTLSAGAILQTLQAGTPDTTRSSLSEPAGGQYGPSENRR